MSPGDNRWQSLNFCDYAEFRELGFAIERIIVYSVKCGFIFCDFSRPEVASKINFQDLSR